jgi:hypothetical protein
VLEAKDLRWKYGRKLAPMRRLTVLVRDKDGKPLKGAKVYLGPEWGTPRVSYPSTTDESGEAVYKYVVPGGVYRAPSAHLDGYYDKGSNDLLKAGGPGWKDTITITMEEARRTQKGRVVDTDGKPLAGLSVHTSFGRKTTSDSNGEFALTNLPDVEVPVWAEDRDCMGSAKSSKATEYITITAKKGQ